MALDPRTPVIIGVGQFVNRVDDGDDLRSPDELMVEALRVAEHDAGSPGCSARADVIGAVPVMTWRYKDPGRLVADAVGATTAATWYPAIGGNTPQMLVNKIAANIADGTIDLGVVVGAESGRSRSVAKKTEQSIDWPKQPDDVAPSWDEGAPFLMGHPSEMAQGILMPTHAYPLFENALWHHSGRTLSDHLQFIGELWSGFSKVATTNPYAWRPEFFSPSEITTPTPENRMVGFPYTKRMVANPDVDMASAIIVCSADRAAALGVPKDQWVFVHSGTDGKDRGMSERLNFTSSPAIGIAGNLALELADVTVDEVAHIDLYSCFPSAVQLAMSELKITADRQLTVYGGLCFAGGPWNNPVGHAIATMVGVLRNDAGAVGLVTANGGHVDKHAFGVYSTSPPVGGFRHARPQELIDAAGGREVAEGFAGHATIETWTVMFERDGSPGRAHAACLTATGERLWAVSTNPELMELGSNSDLVGARVNVSADGVMTLG
jgi:acetyl-CoA C-acetyltransferase